MKVLVLDTSAMARRLIREELDLGGYEVLEAESRARALSLLKRTPGISLLTTPVVLEDGDGFGFISQLRSDELKPELERIGNHDVPAILVTANDTDADRLRGFQVGAADFIQKPWRRGRLLAHVDSILGRGEELAGMQVLVADDSPFALRFVRTCLTRLGVEVHEADDGDVALAFLRERRVDMLVTDLNMVRMHGDELCLKVRGELGLAELPVIFLTANEDKTTMLALFKLGATDYLRKPFLQEELTARLKVHLERERLISALRQMAEAGSTAGEPHAAVR
jgi:two-component system cell cycle response regulator